MTRNVSIQHIRGVDANKPVLVAGEFYCATDTGRVYHGIAPFHLVPVVEDLNLVTQSAAIPATIAFTPLVTGSYLVNFYLKVTRTATGVSTLGPLTLTYSDGTDSVALSVIAQGQTQAGVTSTTNTGNSTSSVLSGQVTIWAVAGTSVKYAIAYSSSGATTMQYEAHLKVILL